MNDTLPRTYSVHNVVVDVGLPSVRWLQAQIRSGAVEAVKVGREWRMTDDQVRAMLAANTNTARREHSMKITGDGLTARSRRRKTAA